MAGGATPAIRALEALGTAFETRTYAYDPGADRVGLQAAAALGESPARVLKTLIVDAAGTPVCAVLASDREVAMKRLASAAGAKTAAMMPVPAAERLTGYKVGGVSPFGQKRQLPSFVDAAALDEPYIFVNGGARGLQIRLAPSALVAALAAQVVPITG